ncbi:MAG: rod shape-determining protein MreC [Actinobacteria bacterium]|nr:rod shape-determining protein MreC [Actinomycetota bacterium]
MRISRSDRSKNPALLLVALTIASLILITVHHRGSDAGPLHNLRLLVHSATAPVASIGSALFSPLRSAQKWLSTFGVDREQATALRGQNTLLRNRIIELEEARLENQRLQALLGIVEQGDISAVGARIIGRPVNAWEGYITLDRGTNDGIASGMPVMAEGGLLGQTTDVAERSSKVRLITDQGSGVSSLLQPTRAHGVVSGSVNGELVLQYVSRETTVAVGDAVITSGMGGVYPKGLRIGEVAEYRLRPGDLFPKIQVRPAVQLWTIEEVVVLKAAPVLPEIGGSE